MISWKIRLLLLLIVYYLLSGVNTLTSQSLVMKSYTEDDGLVGQVVYDITQGPDGKIWAITDKALNIFDGQKWEVITEIKGELLPSNRYSRIIYDNINNQILLFGNTNINTFKLFKYTKNQWFEIETPIKDDHFLISAYNISDRQLSIFSESGHINIYNVKDDLWLSDFHDLKDIYNVGYYNNNLTVFSSEGVFTIYLDNRNIGLKKITISDDLPKGIELILNDKVYKNQTIVLYADKFYRTDNFSFNITHKRNIEIKSKTQMTSLMQVYQSDNDNLFIISNDQFFIANESGRVESVISNELDNDQWINRFVVDNSNVIWLATNKGIKKIDSFMLRHFDTKNGLMMNEVTAVDEFNNGTIFIGLNKGYQLFYNHNEKFLFDSKSIFESATPRILTTSHKKPTDEIYVAANSSGLLLINGKSALNFKKIDDGIITDVLLHKDTLYYSKDNYSINIYANNKIKKISSLDKYDNGFVRRIYNYKQLLVLTKRGIFQAKSMNQVYSGLLNESNLTSSTYSLIPFNEGYLVGTLGGLVYWNGINDDDNKLIEIDGMKLDMSVYTSIYDKYGRLFLGTNKGVYIINSKFDKVRIINKSDGLLSNEINRGALKELQNGDIYIGTDKGLSIYRSKFDEINLSAPEATVSHSIESDFIKGNTIYIFKINIPNYYDISSHRVRYKLTGFDDDFKEIARSQLQDIVYTNLNSGKYQFEVQVKHKNSKWSTPFVSEEIEVSQNVIISYFKWIFIFLLVTIFTSYLFKKYPISKPQV